MTQGFWKMYKAKVLQTLGGEAQQDDLQDERENPELMEATGSTLLAEEGSNPVSQLARRVQGAGAKGWRTMSSLFSREDEHKLLPAEPPADHPLAAAPAEEPPSEKKAAGLWDVFAAKWQQSSASEGTASKAHSGEQAAESSAPPGEMADEDASSTGQDNDLREAEGVAFKWSFLTNKLAEMKNKSTSKSN